MRAGAIVSDQCEAGAAADEVSRDGGRDDTRVAGCAPKYSALRRWEYSAHRFWSASSASLETLHPVPPRSLETLHPTTLALTATVTTAIATVITAIVALTVRTCSLHPLPTLHSLPL